MSTPTMSSEVVLARIERVLGYSLTDEQRAVVTAPPEPFVVVAGAGTGKTTVMAARVVWLVGTGVVEPAQVLGLTFTNKAAGELAARVRLLLRSTGLLHAPAEAGAPAGAVVPLEEPTVLTYHAYAGRLLREHALRIGVEPGARLLADATRFQLATRVVATYRGSLRALSHSVPVVVEDLLSLDAELAEHLVETDTVRAHDRAVIEDVDLWLAASTATTKVATEGARTARTSAIKRLELLDLVDALRAERRRADTLDFSDQMRVTAELVATCPPVAAQQRDAFRVVLLDEYQDTSVAQRLMLQSLYADGHAVTAVGDPCQAIYGWRGASVRNIDEFGRDFPRADGAESPRFALSVNNRSDEVILDVANALAEPLRAVHPGVAPLRPRDDLRACGSLVTAVHLTQAEELAWVADEVARLVRAGGDPNQIAVLLRATREAPHLREALLARDVPVDVVGLGGLLDVPEVADVVATLEVLDDPTANPALVRLLSGPRWRIGARDLALLGRRAAHLTGSGRGDSGRDEPDGEARLRAALADAVAGIDPTEVVSLADALDDLGDPQVWEFSAEARERLTRFAAELAELRRHHAEPVAEVLARVITASGIDVEVAALPHGDGGAALAQIADVAGQFSDVDGASGVRAFLAYTRAARRHDRGLEPPADATGHGVKLLTAHKAKGLEFDVVFVPTLVQKVFPSSIARPQWTRSACTIPAALRGDAADRPELTGWDREAHEALKQAEAVESELEERRLAYVAATRARHRLVLSGHWWGSTQLKVRGPSSYLQIALDLCRARGDDLASVAVLAERPGPDEDNPQIVAGEPVPWPAPLEPEALRVRREVADAVRAARAAGAPTEPAPTALDDFDRAVVASWDQDLEALLREARGLHAAERVVPVPPALSASITLRLLRDPTAFAAALARPMPRPPAPAATRGTRFHAWVEGHFQTRQLGLSDLVDVDDPDSVDAPSDRLGDLGSDLGDDDLAALRAAFLAGPFADRAPLAVEAPFGVMLGSIVVRGRIDAVYAEPDGGFLVVDWKTGTRAPDPVQLALYRVAIAELHGVPESQVRAVFYTVPTGELAEPEHLPGRAELEKDLARLAADA